MWALARKTWFESLEIVYTEKGVGFKEADWSVSKQSVPGRLRSASSSASSGEAETA